MFIAMFMCQRIYENEIIVISGAYKLMEYEGYSNSFKFVKLNENVLESTDKLNENILALDATMYDHYLYKNVMQDISKFYSACNFCKKKHENPGISTGSWGCGAFGCDRAHKFLQQLICAKSNHVKLFFSTFGKADYQNSLNLLFRSVIQFKPKVSDLWNLIIQFKGNKDDDFHLYLKEKLGNEFYM